MHPLPPRGGPAIGFAHRGARAERRENTLDAFARALELGATGLESDAWITADGRVVLDHDGATGPPWRRRPIAAQPRSALPPHIPTLADLYEQCGTAFELSLDVKDPAALPDILAVATQASARDRLWLCHDDWRLLAGWRAADATVRLVESIRADRIPGGLEAHAPALHQAGVDALNLHRSAWTVERVRLAHQAGLRAFGWDAQAPTEIARLLALDLDGLYSDHVDRLMAAIQAA
ncbi:MAG TPA: glycerophosphodiester phosphodiesterase [Acidimicrobiales bacterium]